jgi:lysophospholipase L1-like esterase
VITQPSTTPKIEKRDPALALRHISRPRIIALGDSSVFGVGDHGDAIPSVGAGWAGRLAHDLTAGSFVNVAKNGARARHITKHQLSAAHAFRPDLALVCIGTNDVLRGDFSPEEIKGAITTVIETLSENNAVIVLLGLPDPISTAPGPLALRKILSARVALINEIYVELSKRENVILVPTWDSKIAHERRMWHVDRMHPSAIGHQLIADLVRRKLALPRRSAKKLSTSINMSKKFELYWLVTNGAKWFAKRSIDLVPALIWLMISENIRSLKARHSR